MRTPTAALEMGLFSPTLMIESVTASSRSGSLPTDRKFTACTGVSDKPNCTRMFTFSAVGLGL